jgi:hypothetical protein
MACHVSAIVPDNMINYLLLACGLSGTSCNLPHNERSCRKRVKSSW